MNNEPLKRPTDDNLDASIDQPSTPDQPVKTARAARLRLAILTGMTVGASVVAVATTHEPGTTSISVSIG